MSDGSIKSSGSNIALQLKANLNVSKSYVEEESNSGNSDDTDSQIDENKRLTNYRFRNNRKSKHLECRSMFKVESRGKEHIGICNSCNETIKMSSNSDANLRTHLAHRHGKPEFMTKSQLKIWKIKKHEIIENMEETRMTPQQKRELREKLVDSIIEDSRAFNDFSRSGIKDLFNFLMPGYHHLVIVLRKF